MRMTDAELIGMFLGGEAEAFNTLVRRWERDVYNFVLRYAGNREDARDLCQSAFVKAYRRLHRLKDPERFSPWIYQIALNACRDRFRSQQRRPTCSLDALQVEGMEEALGMATLPGSGPDDAAHPRDVGRLLQRAMQRIPEEQRAVVIMKEYHGLKFAEISEALRVPLNTVKSRMYYGLKALRGILEAWHIDEETVRYEL